MCDFCSKFTVTKSKKVLEIDYVVVDTNQISIRRKCCLVQLREPVQKSSSRTNKKMQGI